MIGRLSARMRAHGLSNAALLVASSIACLLTAVIPIYASFSAVAILDDLTTDAEGEATPPFSYFFATDAGLDPVAWSSLAEADQYLLGEAADDLALPQAAVDARLVSRRFALTDAVDDGPTQMAFTSIDRFDELAVVVDGAAPRSDGVVIEVLVSEGLAGAFPVGSQILLLDELLPGSDPARLITVRVAGVWEPIDGSDQRWIVSPSILSELLVVPRARIVDQLQEQRPDVIATAQWSLVGDASTVEPGALADLARRARTVSDKLGERSPVVSLARDPSRLLTEVAARRAELAETLRAYAVPAGLLTVVFVGMVISFNIQQRRTELSVLRSRGLPVRYSVGSIVGEVAVVVGAAAVLGGLGALALAQLMVRSTAFLTFGAPPVPAPFWQPAPLGWLALTAATIVVAHTVMLIRPARDTIVARQASRGRLAGAGRSFVASLDLIVIAFVAALLLQRRALPIADDGLRDPWIIALPAATGLAVGLLVVRVLPVLASQAARLLERTRAVSWFLGAQRMARAPRTYRRPVILIVVATALTAFTASLSLTLERRLIDETYLAHGADHVVVEITPGRETNTPLSIYLDSPGVAAVSRSAELEGRFGETKVANRTIEVIAVDPASFAEASHWQADYDDQTLTQLLAPLRSAPGAVIVSSSLAETYDLAVGDPLRFAVGSRFDASGAVVWLDTGGVVGAITDRFPRWTGSDKAPLLVMDIDLLSGQVDRLERATTLIHMDDPDLPLTVDGPGLVSAASDRLGDARREPERQAVFAILTTTFGIAMAVALLSLVLQTMATFRERTLDVGVLRAMGIARGSVRSLLSFDFIVIALAGVAGGTTVGVAMASWLIPDLVESANSSGELEPTSALAWPTIAITAAAFLVVAAIVVAAVAPMLSRRNVFEALKLGETQ